MACYFNLPVGGPRNGPLHLLDSNVDWEQDLLLVERWVKDHPELPLDGVRHSLPNRLNAQALIDVPFGTVPQGHPIKYDGTKPKPRETWDLGPQPGRYAVSVKWIYGHESGVEYFQNLEPIARIGWTARVYEVTAEDAERMRKKLGYGPLETP